MKLNKKVRQKTYEIHVPIKDTWVYSVISHSKKEALKYYISNGQYLGQDCTISGWPNRKGNILIKVVSKGSST